MLDPRIFIVRVWPERDARHGFRATVRAVDSADARPVGSPVELAASLLPAAVGVPSPPLEAWRRAAVAVVLLAMVASLLEVSVPAPAPRTLGYALLAATGLVSGFLSGLLGIGGALIVVPAMYLLLPLLGVEADRVPHVAVGSALLAMLPTSLAATLAQHRRGGIDTAWLSRLAPGVAVGAAIGATLALSMQGPVLSMLFALQSFYYGWGLMRARPAPPHTVRGRLLGLCGRCPPWVAGPAIAAFCACAGMGGGSLTVPYMVSRGVALLRAAATSCALNLCIAVGGGLAVSLVGLGAEAGSTSVSWPAAAIVGGSALLSVRQGVALAHRLPVATFRRLLGAVTLLGAAVLTARTAWVLA